MQHLTALRGISAFFIVLYHIKPHLAPFLFGWAMALLNNAYLAVDFFFVLSGFILSYNYESILARFDSEQIKSFIVKRIARIYPLHLLILLSYILIPLAHLATGRSFDSEERYALDNFLFNVLLIQNWGFTNGGGWNVPSWSISTELLAYLTFPFVVAALAGRALYLKAVFVAALYIITIGFFYTNGAENIGEFIAAFGFIRCLLGFYFGYLIHCVFERYKAVDAVRRFAMITLLFIAGLVWFFGDIQNYFYVNAVIALIVYVLITNKEKHNKIFEMPVFMYLGKVSYSLYMVHYFVRDLMSMLFLDGSEAAGLLWITTYIAVTLLISHFTYHYIEVKCRYLIVDRYKRLA